MSRFGFRRRRFKRCPHCGWEIRAEAVKCRYCGAFLDGASSAEGEGRRLCRIVAGISGIILLVGVAILILQSGIP